MTLTYHSRLRLECLELVRVSEKDVGADEEMHEVPVRVAYELYYVSVRVYLDLVIDVLKNALE